MLQREMVHRLPVLALLLAVGCGGSGSGDSDADASTGFVAYESSFQGFEQWSSAAANPSDAGLIQGDGLHVGPLKVFWNEAPPHGATAFPVGTIIVKESEQIQPGERVIFAMVKRGDGFNSGGANGWEWYSLEEADDGSITILWSGVVPPPGETYANQTIGVCNGCHTKATSNDSVFDTALQLSDF
jgi:hypothetical protein